ncbi:glutathione transferase omega class [Trametes coccinea BRFM310]|uniref:Glutathione transferase omega class n=1 Tax=Trametes coccinea (strain BRFM310) TaxID=1353009 RepID=A0A1Y2INA0_TRAC3|nr:glutathione transferase omega class [Trametes coccinea BRFM310]
MSEDKRIILYAAVSMSLGRIIACTTSLTPFFRGRSRLRHHWIDLLNKEEWYQKKVNPAGGKVPLLVFGGPKLHPADAPSADAVKITESLVILEFLADILPTAHLLPEDPVLRARARFFNATVDTKLLKAFMGFRFFGGSLESLLVVLEEFQAMLPPTGFVVGEWSIADAAFSPILVRLVFLLSTGLGNFARETGREGVEAFESPRFARLRQYYGDVIARPSMATTWDEVSQLRSLWRSAGAESWAAAQEAVRAATVRRMDRFRKTGIINSTMRLPVPAT